MNLWKEIPLGKKFPKEFNMVVEIPMGTSNKYEYDNKKGIFRLDRVLYSPVHYPGNYGFIPETLWLDNDPMDILVLSSQPVYPGIIMKVRPLGVLRLIDRSTRDDKVLAVPFSDPRFSLSRT